MRTGSTPARSSPRRPSARSPRSTSGCRWSSRPTAGRPGWTRSKEDVEELTEPTPPEVVEALELRPVSTAVNNVANNGPRAARPGGGGQRAGRPAGAVLTVPATATRAPDPERTPPAAPLPAWVAAAVTFLSSGAVLVLEIVGLRLIAPYVGVTLQTSTAVIGFALAAIAIGAWTGGATADRTDPRRLIAPLMVAGGRAGHRRPAARALHRLAAHRRGRGCGAAAGRGRRRRARRAAVRRAADGGEAAAVEPRRDRRGGRPAVRHRHAGRDRGHVRHRLPAHRDPAEQRDPRRHRRGHGRRRPRRSGCCCAGGRRRRAAGCPVALLVLAVAGALLAAVAPTPCEEETAYHCARVVADPERDSGRVLVLDTLRHSYVDLDDPTHLEFEYVRAIAAVTDVLAPGGRAALRPARRRRRADAAPLPGRGAPGHATAWCSRWTRGWSRSTGSSWAWRRPTSCGSAWRTAGSGWPRSRPGSGTSSSATPSAACRCRGSSPPARRCELVDRALADDGVYAVNLIDHPPLAFVRAELATLREVFAHVVLLARIPVLSGGGRRQRRSPSPRSSRWTPRASPTRWSSTTWPGGSPRAPTSTSSSGTPTVLTDDHAPVDQLLTPYGRP